LLGVAGWEVGTLAQRNGVDTDLVACASSVLAREASRLVGSLLHGTQAGPAALVPALFADERGSDPAGEERVPLLSAGPARAGALARATMRVANEEATPSTVSLYTSNFVADSGYEIAARNISISPRSATVAAGAQANFSVSIEVPAQAPAGLYSGLIQVLGSRYVKAVLSVEVL
jgi:hypothetical protein